jgi:hypothetical protein
MVFPTLAEEADNAVSELAEGHRVEGRGVKPGASKDAAKYRMTSPCPGESATRR